MKLTEPQSLSLRSSATVDGTASAWNAVIGTTYVEEGIAVNTSVRGFGEWLLAASLVAGLGWQSGAAHEPEKKPDHQVVLRVSSSMLNTWIDGKEDVNREVPVQEVILGTSVFGTSRVTGKPVVKLVESPDRAKFQIVLKGIATSRTTGYNGPAIVTSRAVTQFTATKLVVFEPGKGFSGQPAQVTARTTTTVENIDSSRGGIIGRIVRRRAAAIEAGQHAQVEQIASQRAARRIQLAFDKTTAARLAKLNEMADVNALAKVTGHALQSGEGKYACCTTPHYFQIATSFGDSGPLLSLPKYDPANPANAPVEVWVHDSLIGEPIATGIDMLTAQAQTNKLALTVSAAAKVLTSSEATDKIPTILGVQPLNLQKVGHWRVAKLEIPAPELAEVVNVLRPTFDSNPSKSVVAGKNQIVKNPVVKNGPTANRPVANGHRTWTSGKFTAHARFLGLEGSTVKLQRSNGVNSHIEFGKLSAADQEWIKQYLAYAPRTAAK